MSKIYDRYLELKEANVDKMYLFRAGKFYIFIADDCDKINDYVVLKKVNFTNSVLKCGFPENVLDDYLRIFKNHNLDVEVIDSVEEKNKEKTLFEYIKAIDLNATTPLEALKHLEKIQNLAKKNN